MKKSSRKSESAKIALLESDVAFLSKALHRLENTAQEKEHWVQCAGRLMKENELLRNGIAPTLRESNIAVSVLAKAIPEDKGSHKAVMEAIRSHDSPWWKKQFDKIFKF